MNYEYAQATEEQLEDWYWKAYDEAYQLELFMWEYRLFKSGVFYG